MTADQAIADVRVDDFDALVIPGGYSPDKLRINEGMVEFTREFVRSANRSRPSATPAECSPRPSSSATGG